MFVIFILILGLIIGSFVASTVERLANDKPFLSPRSMCPHCGEIIRLKNNIPLISYFIQNAKTVCCQKRISSIYPIVEIVSVFIFFVNFTLFSGQSLLIISLLTTIFLIIFFIDFYYFIIFDNTLFVLLLISVFSFFINNFNPFDTNLYLSLLASVSAILIFYTIKKLFFSLRKKNGLGEGDIKLVGILALWTGLSYLPYLIILASLFAILHVIINKYIIQNSKDILSIQSPYGSYLVISFLCMIYLINL